MPRPSRLAAVSDHRIAVLYTNGWSTGRIAEHFGVHRTTVARAIRRVHPHLAFRKGRGRNSTFDLPLTEHRLRALAKQIDGVWYPPAGDR